jgi:hypothetical protein
MRQLHAGVESGSDHHNHFSEHSRMGWTCVHLDGKWFGFCLGFNRTVEWQYSADNVYQQQRVNRSDSRD